MNTKLHAVADATGRPIGFFMSAGQVYPAIGEDMGYLVWRKRNCCVL